jgi:hypothetical protein
MGAQVGWSALLIGVVDGDEEPHPGVPSRPQA